MSEHRTIWEGIRVLDLTRSIAGPWATRMMLDAGAEVIKLEPAPFGDLTRPLSQKIDDLLSYYFWQTSSGKLSICVDLHDDQGHKILLDLIAKSDVVIHNMRKSAADKIGLSWERVARINPRAVFCAIRGYYPQDLDGKPGNDVSVQCLSGITALSGPEDSEPIVPIWSLGDTMTAIHCYNAVTSAVYISRLSDQGCSVDVVMTDCAMQFHDVGVAMVEEGREVVRGGRFHPFLVVRGIAAASDGWVTVSAFRKAHWKRLAPLLGTKYMTTQYEVPIFRREQRAEIVRVLDNWASQQSAVKVVEQLRARGIPAAIVSEDFEQTATGSRFVESKTVVQVTGPDGRTGWLGNSILHPEAGEQHLQAGPPRLGAHTVEVLRDMLGYPAPDVARLIRDGVVHVDPVRLESTLTRLGS